MGVSIHSEDQAVAVDIDDLNNIPIKFLNGATVFMKDIGQVHDGWRSSRTSFARKASNRFC